jgi:VanZ family protein
VNPRQRLIAARLACVAVVLLATLTHLDLSANTADAAQRLHRALAPSLSWRDVIDGLRNIALFAGLGVVWVVTSPSGRVAGDIQEATFTGLGLSALVEGVQVFSTVRTASLVDVATNTLGALLGGLTIAWLIVQVRSARGAKSYVGVPTFVIAGSYLVAVTCEALTPLFRSDLLPDRAGGPIARVALALHLSTPMSWGAIPWFDLVLFAPAGFLAVMWLAERGTPTRRSWFPVAVAGAAAAVGGEVAHGMWALTISWEAVITHAVSLACGAWAAHRWLASLTRRWRGAARARAAHLALLNLLILWAWRPLLPEAEGSVIASQFTLDHLIPLRSLAERVDVFSALHVVEQGVLYLPWGALLAVWPWRLTGRWSGMWPGVWAALALEAGHILIVDRYLDVTNALVAIAGLGIGWIVVRRSGFAPYGAALAGVHLPTPEQR